MRSHSLGLFFKKAGGGDKRREEVEIRVVLKGNIDYIL